MQLWLRQLIAFVLWAIAMALIIPMVQSTATAAVELSPAVAIGVAALLGSIFVMRGYRASLILIIGQAAVYVMMCYLVVERLKMGVLR